MKNLIGTGTLGEGVKLKLFNKLRLPRSKFKATGALLPSTTRCKIKIPRDTYFSNLFSDLRDIFRIFLGYFVIVGKRINP